MRGHLGWFPAKLLERALEAQGVTLPEVLSDQEEAFMSKVWPQIRVAARFSDINWGAIGYPNGPELSPASYAAVDYIFPQIRVAADFSHPTWTLHRIPANIIAAALPPPEVEPAPVVTAAPAPPVPAAPVPPPASSPEFSFSTPSTPVAPSYNPFQNYAPSYSEPIPDPSDSSAPKPAGPVKAGLFGGMSWPVLLGLTAAGWLIFGPPKLSDFKPHRPRRSRRRR